MAAIKRFFEKRKLEVKFKKAGDGHKLTEDTRSVPKVSKDKGSAAQRSGPNEETRRAATAALTRVTQPMPGTSGGKAYNMSALKSQMSQEMEAERKASQQAKALAETYAPATEVQLDGASLLAVSGVFFKCPLVGPIALPKKEMEQHIYEFLLSQIAEEPEMTSALIIYTMNKDAEKVKICIGTLDKYMDNVISNPKEEKFRKIRINNKAFQERVLPLEGTQEFLQSVGFQLKSLPGPNQVDEDFYVLDEDHASDTDRLKALKDVLLTAEAIKPELDHNLQVLYPSPQANKIEVPRDFYNISPEELKKEQQIRQEAVEKLGMLRTKEMRERERQKELRRYRYTLIRVRFPDGILLQGTFRAREKLKAVNDFVREAIELDWIPFHLTAQTGQKLEEDQTLAELDLTPAAVVNFAFDKTVLAEVTAQQGSSKIERYLKPEIQAQIHS